MEKITNWQLLWQELVALQDRFWHLGQDKKQDKDFWKGRARKYDKMVKKRWTAPDASRTFIQGLFAKNPEASVVDIGAGTGAWTLFMARHAARVTAIEPSNAMCEVMAERLAEENITNVTIVQGNWQDVDIEPHDFSFASHSMYGVADFKGFVEKMVRVTGHACMLLMRVLLVDAIMARAAMRVLGQPYDSPCFQVAYNALMQMDIYPDVVMEAAGNWAPWTHDTLDEAVAEVKNRLGLKKDERHDAFLNALLKSSLREESGKYVWPIGNRSGIVYWRV